MGHRYVKDKVARSIGWPTGHRFQNEVSWMNAGIAVAMASVGIKVSEAAPI